MEAQFGGLERLSTLPAPTLPCAARGPGGPCTRLRWWPWDTGSSSPKTGARVSLRPVQSQKPRGLEDVTGPGISLGRGTSIHKTPPRQSSGRTSEKIVHYFYGKFPKIFTRGLGWVGGGPAGSVALWPVPRGQEAGCGHAGGDSAQPGAWTRAHYPGDLSATRPLLEPQCSHSSASLSKHSQGRGTEQGRGR